MGTVTCVRHSSPLSKDNNKVLFFFYKEKRVDNGMVGLGDRRHFVGANVKALKTEAAGCTALGHL